MTVSKNWGYCIYDDRDPDEIPHGLNILDHLKNMHDVSELYYGFMRKLWRNRRFGIEGYVCFMDEKTIDQVRQIFPRFKVRVMNPSRNKVKIGNYIRRRSIFIKYGLECVQGQPVRVLNQEWLYNYLN